MQLNNDRQGANSQKSEIDIAQDFGIVLEWYIEKFRIGKTLLYVFRCTIYYSERFCHLFKQSYKNLRSQSRVPTFTDIDFNKNFYPFVIFFAAPPIVFLFLFSHYLSELVWGLILIVYVILLGLAITVFLLYLLYRLLIDAVVSGYYFSIGLVKVTLYSFKKAKAVLPDMLEVIIYG